MLNFFFIMMLTSSMKFSNDISIGHVNVAIVGVSKLNYVYVNQILSSIMRKLTFCICKNKDADQLRGNREADQRLCFRYIDSTIPPLPKYEIFGL